MNESNLEFPLTVLFTIVSLIIVLVVAWYAIRLLSALNNTNTGGTKPVKILHTTALSGRERLVLIEYKGRDILLGVSAGGISVIDNQSTQRESDS